MEKRRGGERARARARASEGEKEREREYGGRGTLILNKHSLVLSSPGSDDGATQGELTRTTPHPPLLFVRVAGGKSPLL
jgi:hypothetical protein